MGYTHYFKQEKPVNDQQWKSFQKDAEIMLKEIQSMGIVLMSNDENDVLINNERVNLNGDESCGLDHETFYMDKDYRRFNFCKTARKPYDLAVCSLLLLANEHMPEHHDIGSDGDFEDWKEAMELNAEILGYGFKLPSKISGKEDANQFEEELAEKYTKKENDTIKTESKPKKNTRYNL